jgi:hypothetical protein
MAATPTFRGGSDGANSYAGLTNVGGTLYGTTGIGKRKYFFFEKEAKTLVN